MRLVISLAVVLLCIVAKAQPADVGSAALPESRAGVGYPSVQAALESLKAAPGAQVQITQPDAWTIVSEPGDIQWSFVPKAHAAYPAVVRRILKVKSDGGLYVEMSGLCEAEELACDKLMDEFKELNERIRLSVDSSLKK